MTFRTRFAPSPTGPLHLGHAYSAMLAYDTAQAERGEFLLRLEDIDQSRARPQWEAQIYEDLDWLGLHWPTPVMRQSQRLEAYGAALDQLWQADLLYPCSCNRRDIMEAASAPQEGVPMGPDGIVYSGTCARKPKPARRPDGAVLRLDMGKACEITGAVTFTEIGEGPEGQCGPITTPCDTLRDSVGDIVVARRDMGTSYHLAVTVDDSAQGITHVIRGQDLFEATPIHVVLQRLLGLSSPSYHHHRLIRDDAGKRLAKRDDARALAKFRAEGATPTQIRQRVGLTLAP